MTFFEQELRKIIGTNHPDATYAGRACYLRLNDMNRVKLEFATCGTADHYEALKVTILNRNDGPVDKLLLRFADVLGVKEVNSKYIKELAPYAWTYDGKTEWYAYHPTREDYAKLSRAVNGYIGIFQELREAPQEWEHTM